MSGDNLLTINIQISGVLLMLLGLAHIPMPRYFGWKEECAHLSLFTRQVHFVHHAYIGLTVFLNGLLCAFFANELVTPGRLATGILVGLTFFWFSRLIVQLFVYSSENWRGKRFETAVQYLFTGFWIYLSCVYGAGVWHQLRASG